MIISVSFEATVPDDANPNDIAEWLYFELKSGSMKVTNPLSKSEIEVVNDVRWHKVY